MTAAMNPDESAHRGRRLWPSLVIGLAAMSVALGIGYGIGKHRTVDSDPDADAMADRAATVMPFNLKETTHAFTKTDTGGVEEVVANDPADAANIALIRQHLSHEANRFADGDYSDPARIHGADMPGLRELQAGADRVQVRYDEIPAGARITYTAADPVLVAALHSWFDAQTSDHSMPGMGMEH